MRKDSNCAPKQYKGLPKEHKGVLFPDQFCEPGNQYHCIYLYMNVSNNQDLRLFKP